MIETERSHAKCGITIDRLQRGYNGVFVVSIGVICALAWLWTCANSARVLMSHTLSSWSVSHGREHSTMMTSDKDLSWNQVLFYFRSSLMIVPIHRASPHSRVPTLEENPSCPRGLAPEQRTLRLLESLSIFNHAHSRLGSAALGAIWGATRGIVQTDTHTGNVRNSNSCSYPADKQCANPLPRYWSSCHRSAQDARDTHVRLACTEKPPGAGLAHDGTSTVRLRRLQDRTKADEKASSMRRG